MALGPTVVSKSLDPHRPEAVASKGPLGRALALVGLGSDKQDMTVRSILRSYARLSAE